MEALPDRENVYVQYRFGFTDGKAHPLTETAQYFHLTESRAKGIERSALKLLKHELIIEIPERAYAWAEDRLTRRLVAEGELHAVELRLKSQQKRGKKITAAVYEYFADCDGKWGELRYNFNLSFTSFVLRIPDDQLVFTRSTGLALIRFSNHVFRGTAFRDIKAESFTDIDLFADEWCYERFGSWMLYAANGSHLI